MNLNTSSFEDESPLPELVGHLDEFIENRKNEMKTIVKDIESSDTEGIKQITHVWKGISQPYGCATLADLGHELSMAAGDHDFKECEKIYHKIEDYLFERESFFKNEGFI